MKKKTKKIKKVKSIWNYYRDPITKISEPVRLDPVKSKYNGGYLIDSYYNYKDYSTKSFIGLSILFFLGALTLLIEGLFIPSDRLAAVIIGFTFIMFAYINMWWL